MIDCGIKHCNKINAGIDPCIADLIDRLNECGLETISSCCGHNLQPTRISLRDGRELFVVDYEQAQKISNIFPPINPKSGDY